MYIYGHNIDRREIIGCSPIKKNFKNTYWFMVYLRGHAIKIVSEPFEPGIKLEHSTFEFAQKSLMTYLDSIR